MRANGAMSDLIYRELADWPWAVGDRAMPAGISEVRTGLCEIACESVYVFGFPWPAGMLYFVIFTKPNPLNYYY